MCPPVECPRNDHETDEDDRPTHSQLEEGEADHRQSNADRQRDRSRAEVFGVVLARSVAIRWRPRGGQGLDRRHPSPLGSEAPPGIGWRDDSTSDTDHKIRYQEELGDGEDYPSYRGDQV